MSLTPPRLRRGSVPAQDFSHGGHGGSEASARTHDLQRTKLEQEIAHSAWQCSRLAQSPVDLPDLFVDLLVPFAR